MKTIMAFDDFVLNRSDNTKRVFKQPEWRFDLAYSDSDNPRGIWPASVVRAPQGGYIMSYMGVPGADTPIDDEHMAVFQAYSEDGLHFAPNIKLRPEAKYRHMLGLASEDIGVHVTEDTHETDPRYRYKAPHAKYGYQDGKLVEDKAYLLASPDMVHWEKYSDAAVTPSYEDCYMNLMYNPVTGRYQVTTRRRWGERRICLVESEDLKSWTFPRAIIHPQPSDEPNTHLYSMPHYYYEPGEVFIGLLWKQVMPFHRISEGPVTTEYAYSYDGLMWNRTGAELFPKLPRDVYGGGSSYVFNMLDRGEDILFYCNAYICEHGGIPKEYKGELRSRSVMIPGVLKKNRFVAIDSGKGTGELVTQNLRLKKPELYINANVPFGSLKAELLSGGRAIEGFGLDDFEPICGDNTDFPLRWKGDLRALMESGKWFELHIVFEQAEVYAIMGDFDFTINTRGPVYERL